MTQTATKTDYHLRNISDFIDEFLVKNYPKRNCSSTAEEISVYLTKEGMKQIDPKIFDLRRRLEIKLSKHQAIEAGKIFVETYTRNQNEINNVRGGRINLSFSNAFARCSSSFPVFYEADINSNENTLEREVDNYWFILPGGWGIEHQSPMLEDGRLIINKPYIPPEIRKEGKRALKKYEGVEKKLKDLCKKRPELRMIWAPKDESYSLISEGGFPRFPAPVVDPVLCLVSFGKNNQIYRNLVAIWEDDGEDFELLKKYLKD